MRTLNFLNRINYLNPLISPSNFVFHFPPLSRKNKNSLHFSHGKWLYNPKTLNLSYIRASSASDAVIYGGWDDLRLVGDSGHSGESDQLPNFLVSIGIDDKKHIFMFILGIVLALAISRVRVSSVVVFPASVLVFAIGFSFGFVRGGSFTEVIASKRRSKEDVVRVYSEKLRNLVDFFDGFNVKIDNLRIHIQRAIDSNKITVGDLEKYVGVLESIRLSALNTRNVVEASIDSGGNSSGVLIENQKSSRRKKDLGEVGFELLQSIGGVLGEKFSSSKHNKVKDNIKQGTMESLANDQTHENILTPAAEQRIFNSVIDNKGIVSSKFSQDTSKKYTLDQDGDRRTKIDLEDGKMSSVELNGTAKKFIDSEEFSYENNRLQFMNNHRVSLKMDQLNETERWESRDNLHDSVNFSVRLKHMETSASFVQEQMLKKSGGAYESSHNREKSGNETRGSRSREERVNHEDDYYNADYPSTRESEVGSSSSSMVADDVLFDRHLTEANDFLKQAKECIRGRRDEEHSELLLHKSAKLLSEAIAMKPMSLLAVGQLGNTYLLHGELKLHISRELRAILSRSDPLSIEKQGRVLKGPDDQFASKDEIASVLINTCEECEELLVKAGRKYRLALSIDGNDVRALYNWGLALSFRAQLIADIGPEAAFDADKVFLAAIDKFDAMMSKGNVYAPDALFRWGVALRQRSRLRPSNSKEKVKLLQQAKRLFEDAVNMNSNNMQAREALSLCISELNYKNF